MNDLAEILRRDFASGFADERQQVSGDQARLDEPAPQAQAKAGFGNISEEFARGWAEVNCQCHDQNAACNCQEQHCGHCHHG